MHVNNLRPAIRVCLLGAFCSLFSGCVSVAGLQDMHFSMCNKYRASESWKCSFSSEQRRNLTCDFESGFKRGYYDTAMNKDCRIPPIAPPKYWAARYQSCEGQSAVQDWFRGYQHGIAAAQSGSCPATAEVPVSPGAPVLNKTGCGACYSPDCCRSGNCFPSMDDAAPAYDYEQSENRHQNPVEDPIDLPNSRAIVPVSFQNTNAGLIGGFGNTHVN